MRRLSHFLIMLMLCLGGVAETLPNFDDHVMTIEERELWKAATEHFKAEPETLSVCESGGKFYGESDRRGGGTCRDYALWVVTGDRWLLVLESDSLDASTPSPAQTVRMREHGLTSDILGRLSKQSFAVLDELPARWDLDIGFKLKPLPK